MIKIEQESPRCSVGHRECENCGACACTKTRVRAGRDRVPWTSRPLRLCAECRRETRVLRATSGFPDLLAAFLEERSVGETDLGTNDPMLITSDPL